MHESTTHQLVKHPPAAAPQPSRELFDTLLSSITDFAYTFDNKGRFTYVNRALLDLWGLPLEAALGKSFFELPYPPDLAAKLQRQIQQVFDTRQGLADETSYTNPTGQQGYYEYIFRPIFDEHGNVVQVAGSTRDITQRKRNEELLAETRRRLNAALIAAEVGTFEWDIVNDRLYGDRNFELFFGVELDVSDAAPLANFVAAIHPDDQEQAMRLVRHSLKTGSDFEAEYRILTQGQERWVIARGRVERDAHGVAVRFPGVLLDITERKHAAEKLRASEEKFYETLLEADRRKDQFLATLAHELRNPLAPIRNGLQILKLAQSPQAIHQAREMMERQLEHMVRLVDDLMDVSRVSQGKIVLKRTRMDLNAIVQQAVEASRPLIQSMNHSLTVTQCARPVAVEADPVRLTQVFGNLLNNACKYMEPGGRIAITTARQGDNILISFKDEGIGIPSDYLPRIFEAFAQLDHTLERAQGGLGIGLTLVRQLIELHGGSVEARSEGVGRGSEFIVRLPILRENPASPAPSTAGPAEILTPRRILVVDDNVDAAASLAMLLQISGCQTHTAHDGPEAVAAASRLAPDIVLLDLGLPGFSGYEVCRRIRGQQHGKTVQIIALTGWGQDEDRHKTLEAGFDSHLVKPVDLQELVALLNRS